MTSITPTAARAFFVAVVAMFCLQASAAAQHKGWTSVTAEERQLSTPKVDPSADAEVLLWDVYALDEQNGDDLQSVLHHYIKIKVYNDRGRESFSKIDIPFGKLQGMGFDIRVRDIAARTTKPDGTAIELKGSDIFERDIVRGSGVRLKAKSFAVPGIEAGSVIEYRWKEIRGTVSYYQRLQLDREIPVHLVRYHVKPLSHPDLGMNIQAFNSKNTPFVKGKDGFYMTSAVSVPAFREEPRMPPEYSLRPWLLLYYTKDQKIEPEKYWKDYGKQQFDSHKSMMKVSDEVKRAAVEAVGTETDDLTKVKRIFDYVRANIKNVLDDRLNLTADQLKQIKENKGPAETLKRRQGVGHDINMLFAAMTTAAGLETRNVNLPRRSDVIFPRWFTDDYFMRTENVAVKIGDAWKFFDPASLYTPFGMLSWEEEGQPALISDGKEPVWQQTPLSAPEKSTEKRIGRFKLRDDGTLEGTVKIEFTGHLGAHHKEYNDEDTPEQRETTLKNLVRSNILSSSEVSEISIDNVSDPDKPFTYEFKVVVPGYATRTGKRIFLQPNVFERSSKPVFEGTERRYDVSFEHSYSERDDIEIELPEGYELESPDAPAPVKDAAGMSFNDIKIRITNDKRRLIYSRDFTFGNNNMIEFSRKSYGALTGLFNAFHKANSHALTLRQAGPPPPLAKQ